MEFPEQSFAILLALDQIKDQGLKRGIFQEVENIMFGAELIESIQIGGAVLMTIPCGVIS